MAESKKIQLTSTHKTFLTGVAGALVAMAVVLGSVGAARAFNGPHDGRMGMPRQENPGRGDMQRGPGGAMGEITKIDNKTITLKGRDDATITVAVDDNTNYQKAGEDAKLSDLKVGDTIMIRGDVTAMSIDADSIGIRQ